MYYCLIVRFFATEVAISRTRDQLITSTHRIFAVFIVKCSIHLCFRSQFYLEGRYSTRNAFLSWIRFSLKWSFIIKLRCSREETTKSFHNARLERQNLSKAIHALWMIIAEQLTTSIQNFMKICVAERAFLYWRIELVKRTMRAVLHVAWELYV